MARCAKVMPGVGQSKQSVWMKHTAVALVLHALNHADQ
jgi:hypothetical protein